MRPVPCLQGVPSGRAEQFKSRRGVGDFLMHIALAGEVISPRHRNVLEAGFEVLGLGREAILPRPQESA